MKGEVCNQADRMVMEFLAAQRRRAPGSTIITVGQDTNVRDHLGEILAEP